MLKRFLTLICGLLGSQCNCGHSSRQHHNSVRHIYLYSDVFVVCTLLVTEKLKVISLNCHGYNIGIESYLDHYQNCYIIL